QWDALWRRSPNATPFQSPHWLLPWWRAFGSDEPYVIASTSNDSLDALAPLYILRDDDSGESLGMFIGTGVTDYLDILGDIEALFELHALRWQKRGLPGVLADSTTQEFHRDAARRLLDAGALRMYAMRIGDRLRAVFYGFAHHDTVYYYLSGYDPELEKISIG